jgi:DNA-binding CsgD family transcriptional regulator
MVQALMTEEEPGAAQDKEIHLSRRQREVLALVAEGATDKEIALRLHLAAKTVAHYVEHSRIRLGAVSRAQAVALAMRYGLLPGPSEPDKTGTTEPDQAG